MISCSGAVAPVPDSVSFVVDTGEVKCIVIYECTIILLKKHTNFESAYGRLGLQGARGKRRFYKSSAISGVGSKYSHVHDPLTETSPFDSDRTHLRLNKL